VGHFCSPFGRRSASPSPVQPGLFVARLACSVRPPSRMASHAHNFVLSRAHHPTSRKTRLCRCSCASEGESFIGSYGRVFDVIVMKRRDEHSGPMHDRAIESGLFESGRPILLSPPLAPRQIATNVLIAWSCSTEQARAIALAKPIALRF